jgi:hypothetical protein
MPNRGEGEERTRRGPQDTEALVRQHADAFAEQVRVALGIGLPDDISALAYVDHHLSEARDETREPILSLLAAGAGAWFGELIRREIGATWIGDGRDPRRLRMLLEPQFVHFAPVDQAFEAILGGSPEHEDHRMPAGTAIDGVFSLRKSPRTGEETSEDAWVSQQLEHLRPVPEDQFYSLTGRYESLLFILELLATRQHDAETPPHRLGLEDYLSALTDDEH